MKIGIPRALFYYYYYYPFWKAMFEYLNYEVVVSDETSENTLENGCSITVSELCEPIKLFNGHVINLINKGVDYIFAPHFYSHGKEWYCSKLSSLPELSKCSLMDIDKKILTIKLTSKTDMLEEIYDYLPLCQQLGVQRMYMRKAVTAGMQAQEEFRNLCIQGYTIPEAYDILDGKKVDLPKKKNGEITIALLGYVNNIYDPYVSKNALQKLRDMGVHVVTFDMLKEKTIEKKKRHMKDQYWVFARKVYYSSKIYAEDPEVDGIIHVSSTMCKPDAEINKLIDDKCKEFNKPFTSLHVGVNEQESRIQADLANFVDLVKADIANKSKLAKEE